MFKRLIGIDYGAARIGVASGQMVTKTATPITTIIAKNGTPDWVKFDKLIKQWRPDEIIIGLPIDTKNRETAITKEARGFAKKIQERYQKPVHLINETFSTREARWRLEEVQQKPNSHLKVDALAACIILETWMNIN